MNYSMNLGRCHYHHILNNSFLNKNGIKRFMRKKKGLQQLRRLVYTLLPSCCNNKKLWAFKSHTLLYMRSEEHTSELQSRFDLVCRLLLEKKKSRRYVQ